MQWRIFGAMPEVRLHVRTLRRTGGRQSKTLRNRPLDCEDRRKKHCRTPAEVRHPPVCDDASPDSIPYPLTWNKLWNISSPSRLGEGMSDALHSSEHDVVMRLRNTHIITLHRSYGMLNKNLIALGMVNRLHAELESNIRIASPENWD